MRLSRAIIVFLKSITYKMQFIFKYICRCVALRDGEPQWQAAACGVAQELGAWRLSSSSSRRGEVRWRDLKGQVKVKVKVNVAQ